MTTIASIMEPIVVGPVLLWRLVVGATTTRVLRFPKLPTVTLPQPWLGLEPLGLGGEEPRVGHWNLVECTVDDLGPLEVLTHHLGAAAELLLLGVVRGLQIRPFIDLIEIDVDLLGGVHGTRWCRLLLHRGVLGRVLVAE